MPVRKDRRRHPRWALRGRFPARTSPIHEATLLDISTGGALIEHVNLVRPGTVSFLTLLLQQQEVGLKCLVVRSVVHRYEIGPTGERDLIYRTGLEFQGTLGRIRAMNR